MSNNAELRSSPPPIEPEKVEELVDQLPPYIPKGHDTTNFKLLAPVASQFDVVDNGLDEIEINTKVTEADSIAGLRKFGKIVDVHPYQDEDIEHYRTRVVTAFRNITNEATIEELMETISFILEIDVSNIDYVDSSDPGIIILGIPQAALNDNPISPDDLVEILNDNTAAGYNVQNIVTGTFTYISPDDYEQNNFESGKGYAGLDENGEPTDGGTYSTILD